VLRIEVVSGIRATANGGAVLGGVVGGVLSKPATSSAAAKPGVQVLTFRIALRMDDGRRLTIHQPQLASGLRAGSRVRVLNGRVLASRPNP
jgi:outer membrane lipoprotein SlyB